ncbi:EAL domain-containing protein [Laribacter hongkongensis]|uniref:EAL domain-containing protein n=1 Tax=Laribacter hongkongensis TaxID=168471 RepID=UPI001EFEE7ED|nr:EAL domain-containing protein [Laribacter hongkongensis]MCG8996382.1 EAL domain-containing protein [Laribacter hongkongensis]MCG9011590.1 EAL domain-containing protein [Laribacter hongkongensis]MCG9048015.1 EAL domain-containing protein [Laribacter hongkongensis]MCG9075066.1 EAL domain-containing protein [Laribacter hongkongensis]
MVIGIDEGWFNWDVIKHQLRPSRVLCKAICTLVLMAAFLCALFFYASMNAENEIYSLSKNRITRVYPILDKSMKSVEVDVESISQSHKVDCEKLDKTSRDLVSNNLFLNKILVFDINTGEVNCSNQDENLNKLDWATGFFNETGWKWILSKQENEPELFYLWKIDETHHGAARANIDLLKNTLQIIVGGVTQKTAIRIGDSAIGYDGSKFRLIDGNNTTGPIEIGTANDDLSVFAQPEKDLKTEMIFRSLPYIAAIAVGGAFLLIFILMYFMHGNITFRRNVLHGIKNGHFIPFYQKIVGPDENVCAVEVLLRWNKKGRMLVGPTEFIDKADKLGLLSPIVENAMEKVINDLPLMSIPIGSVISINLTPLQVNDPSIFHKIECFNKKITNLGYRCMVEITEEGLMVDRWVAETLIKKMRAIGIDVAIDDFGVGNSSLNYIQNYDFNVVKIDRIFIADIHRNHKNLSIVKGLVHMAKDLGMIVVAEGVESESQVKILKELGVDKMQGFLFYKPMPAESMKD